MVRVRVMVKVGVRIRVRVGAYKERRRGGQKINKELRFWVKMRTPKTKG